MSTYKSRKNAAQKNGLSYAKLLSTSALTAAGIIALSASPAFADNWVDLTTTSGGTTTDLSQPNTTNIGINTGRAIVEGDLDINRGWTVNVGAGDLVAIDRENDATLIYGSLNCAGTCHVLDGDGIIVGEGSIVNSRSVTFGTGELLNPEGFMNTGSVEIGNFGDGAITVESGATVNVAEAGLAAFVSPQVSNNGVINAKMGTVVMAAGETVTLDLYGDGLVEVAVEGELADALLENKGEINAQGGTVQMTALAAKDAVDNVINVEGLITVASATQQGGKIVLSGGNAGKVNVAGTLDANGKDAGSVDVTGQSINIAASSKISADGTEKGGSVRLLAKEEGEYAGEITARGKGEGFVETSAGNLSFFDTVKVLADFWLIDPVNITINNTLAGALETQLNTGGSGTGGDALVTTSAPGGDAGNINSNADISWFGDGNLTFNADNDVSIKKGIESTGTGGFNITAGRDISVDDVITTTGGAVDFTAGRDIDIDADVLTKGGSATFTAIRNFSIDDGVLVNTLGSSGPVSIFADDVNIDGYILAGDSTVTIGRSSEGTIDVGDDNGGDMRIDQGEITRIVSSDLKIGNENTTEITVDNVEIFAKISISEEEDTLPAPSQGCENSSGGNPNCVTNFDAELADTNLTLDANLNVDIIGPLTMGAGSVTVDAPVLNLDTTIVGKDILDGDVFALGDDRLIGDPKLATINVFSNNALIQQAIHFSDDDTALTTINVEADTYTENLLINKGNLKLNGNGATVEAASAGSLVTVTADNVNIDPFVFDGLGIANFGINATGADNLIVDGNTFQNFVLTNINVTNSSGVRIFGNTMTAAQKGVHADNTPDIWVYNNDINGATVAGVHLTNTDGTNYANDADIWINRINSGAGATGVLVENSDFATIGAHLTNQPNANDALNGNVITGGENGIVVLNSNNAMIRHNEVSGQQGGDGPASGDGIYVADSTGVEIRDNFVHDIEDEGIQGDNADNAIVDNNRIEDAGRAGISLMRGSDNQTISNNTITNTGHSGIFSSGKGTLNITGNTITNVGSTHGGNNFRNDGIHVDGAFAGEGNAVAGTPFAGGGLIDDNEINGFTQSGIELVNVDSGLTVSNNTIGSTTGGPIGIYNNGSDNTVISTNTISNVGTGVLVNPSFDVDVIGNTIDNVLNGVQLDGSSNILVEDNTISNTTADGVEVNGGDSNKVIDNTIYNIGWDGIQFNGSTNGKIKENDIYNVTGASGIAVMGGSHNTLIHDNNIDDVDRLGIYIWNSNNQQIQFNKIDNAGREGGNVWYLSGIHLEGSNNSTIYKNDIDTTGGNGIQIGGQGNSAAVATTGNKVISNEIGLDAGDENINGDGILVINSHGTAGNRTVISRNEITETKSNANTEGSGIQIIDSDYTTARNNTISHTDWDGIRVVGGHDVRIVDNDITDAQRAGIYAEALTNSRIRLNTVDGTNEFRGISVQGGDTVVVRENTIDNTAKDAIIANGVANLVIRDNLIGTNYGDDTIGGDGIEVIASHGAIIKDNTIENTTENGIYNNGSNSTLISVNTISNVDMHGIKVNPSDYVDIGFNTIHDAGWDGINVEDGKFADIFGNHIHRVGDDGIDVDNNFGVDIKYNTVKVTGLAKWAYDANGIEVSDSKFADIKKNKISWTRDDGIEVDDSAFVDVEHNKILFAGDDGIDVDGSYKADIKGNFVSFTKGDGIQVRDSKGVDIKYNLVSFAKDDGIDVEDSSYADIKNNFIRFVKHNGIEVSGGKQVDIIGNNIKYVGKDGINVKGVKSNFGYGWDVVINDNIISKAGDDGIEVKYSGNTLIDNNDVSDVEDDGIRVSNPVGYYPVLYSKLSEGPQLILEGPYYDLSTPATVHITNNTVDNAGDDGVQVDGYSVELLVDKNIITDSGDNGILLIAKGRPIIEKPDDDIFAISLVSPDPYGPMGGEFNSVITNNEVTNSGERGLYVKGGTHDDVEVTGNIFTDNPVHAEFESGLIDLTGIDEETGFGNQFFGGDVGLYFSPWNSEPSLLSLVDDDAPGFQTLEDTATPTNYGGTIGNQFFDGQSTFFVQLDNNAFTTPGGEHTWLNGLDSTYVTPFGIVQPSTTGGVLTQDIYDFLESRFDHFPDTLSTGIFFFGFVPDDALTLENIEDFFNNFNPFAGSTAGLRVTVTGLPFIGTPPAGGGTPSPFALANIAPAAGDEEGGTTSPQDIEPAAGGDDGENVGCWGDAVNAAGAGGVASLNWGGTFEDSIAAASTCGSETF